MMGRKTLREVRAELEAALGAGPPGEGEVASSLRRFLGRAPVGKQGRPNRPSQRTATSSTTPKGRVATGRRR